VIGARRRAALALLLAQALGASACGDPTVSIERAPVVYGPDDRRQVYEVEEPGLRALAESVVALVPKGVISVGAHGEVRITAPSWGERDDLCPGEPFRDEPALALCTGVLVGDDLLLSAGHCLQQLPCDRMTVVRGLAYRAPGRLRPLGADDVFACREVVARELSPPDAEAQLDHAWLRLDRPAPRARPVSISAAPTALVEGSRVVTIGHGGGVPAKVTAGPVVKARPAWLDFFASSLDVFHGASGSPVLDADGRMVGLLARGGDDWAAGPGGCRSAAHRPEAAGEEEATYAFRALEGLCRAAPGAVPCRPSSRDDGAAAGAGCEVARARPAGALLVAAVALLLRAARRRG
jgi:hypothetical protein